MKYPPFSIKERVWLYQGDSPWHFVTIQKTDGDEMKKAYSWPRRGFGAIPVDVTMGSTIWKTSIFPDKNGTYVLPLKKDVRMRENIRVGDTITLSIQINS